MRRLFRIRLVVSLVALLLIPAATLPFAERLRTEWARYWEPRDRSADEEAEQWEAKRQRLIDYVSTSDGPNQGSLAVLDENLGVCEFDWKPEPGETEHDAARRAFAQEKSRIDAEARRLNSLRR